MNLCTDDLKIGYKFALTIASEEYVYTCKHYEVPQRRRYGSYSARRTTVLTYPVVLLIREDSSNDAVTLTQLDEAVESIRVLHKNRSLSLESALMMHLSIAVFVCKRHLHRYTICPAIWIGCRQIF